jgi:flagellar secretion chaperone FliS
MALTGAQAAVAAYQRVGTQGGVAAADPHRLIAMLLDGALERVARARGHLERGEVADKCTQISSAIAIVDALRASLDLDRGGELAERLAALYDYTIQRLFEGNLKNDVERLDEVNRLLREVKTGWDGIPPDLRGGAAQQVR